MRELAGNRQLLALIERIAAADREALVELIDATSPTLLAVLLRMVVEPIAAGVLLEECFAEVWEMAPLYDRYAGEPWTWLLTVARARGMSYRDKRRGGGKAPPIEAGGLLAGTPEADALMRLPEEQRFVLLEVFLDGLPGGERGSGVRDRFGGALQAFAGSREHRVAPVRDEAAVTLGGGPAPTEPREP